MKKFVCIICALAMILATFSGCGQSTDLPGESVMQSTAESGIKINDGYPLVDETVTLRMVVKKMPDSGSFSEMPFIKNYEALTNVHIEWEEIPYAVFEEKKNLLLASGDLPDAFFNNTLSAYDVAVYGPQGYLLPLNDYINEDITPNLVRVFEQRPEAKALSTLSDGNIYTLPYIEEMGIIHVRTLFYINKTWLDKLNLSVPTTTDEYLDVLRAFRDNDPNGNGKKDEIPYSGVYESNPEVIPDRSFYNLFGAFGRADNKEHIVIENGKVVFTADKEEFKKAIKYLNTMYSEGLMDPEFFTQDRTQFSAKGNNEDNIIGSMTVWRDFQIVGKERAEADFIPIAPLKGPDGAQIWGRENNSEVRSHIFAMSSSNPYPELTMRWVDGLYDEMRSIEMNWGVLDDVLIKDDEGIYYTDYTDKSGKGLTQSEVRHHNTPGNAGDGTPCAVLMDVYDRLVRMESGGAGRKEILDEIYAKYVPDESIPELNFTIEDSELLNGIKMDLIDYVNEMTVKWVTKGGIDNDWDNYLSNLQAYRLEEYLRINQNAYDTYLSNQ